MRRSQFVTLNRPESPMRSQIVTASTRNIRYRPYAFTEQGVAMLSSVLRSQRTSKVNAEIMRAFVRMRRILAANADLARRLDALEQRYDAQFKVVFDAIRQLMAPLPRRSGAVRSASCARTSNDGPARDPTRRPHFACFNNSHV